MVLRIQIGEGSLSTGFTSLSVLEETVFDRGLSPLITACRPASHGFFMYYEIVSFYFVDERAGTQRVKSFFIHTTRRADPCLMCLPVWFRVCHGIATNSTFSVQMY